MKVALIAPTINEVNGVKNVFPRLDRNIINEIIVVDLNSTDGTVEYCKENGYFILPQKSRGYGAAYVEALELTDAEIIIEFNTDGSSLPEGVPGLISKINEGYDLVIASRYRDGAKSYDDDFITRLGNWLFTKMINILFGTSYTDALVGFRAYRRSAFDRTNMTTRGLSWTAQQSIQFAKAGLKITEIGVDEPARIGGERKMHPIKTGLEILRVIIKEFLSGKKNIVTSEKHFDNIAKEYDYWKKKNWYYHQSLKNLMKSLIPPKSRVLEIGCGTGHVLASLDLSSGHGIDISEGMIKIARENYRHRPELSFEAADMLQKSDILNYDFIMLPDTIDHIENLNEFIGHIAKKMMPGTSLIISTVNPLWEPALWLAEKLKMKMPEGPHHWLSIKKNEAIFKNNGLKITRKGFRLLVPKKIPGADWINSRFHKNRLLARLGFGVWWVLKT